MAKRRGRPRAFDEQAVLNDALRVFLRKGFHDASLDDLAAEMGINKPSLYGAFGDKKDLFARILGDYMALIKSRITQAFERDAELDERVRWLIAGAIEQFLPQKADRMGCLVVSITSTLAGDDPDLRTELADFLREADELVETLLARHHAAELSARGQTPRQLALLVNNTAYALALRARAGMSRAELNRCAEQMPGLAVRRD